MPAGIPQSYMYGSRGPMADGSPIRNRGYEQQNTTSGNPNLPIFNTSQSPAPSTYGQQIGTGGQMSGFYGNAAGAIPNAGAGTMATLAGMGYGMSPQAYANSQGYIGAQNDMNAQLAGAMAPQGPPQPQMSQAWLANQRAVLARAQGPQTASAGSAMARGIPANIGQGASAGGRMQSAYMPYFNQPPAPTVPNPVNS